MGLIGRLLGANGGGAVTAVGAAVQNVAQVFTPNATRQLELSADAQMAALSELGAEFAATQAGNRFDAAINGLNRLPRPALALGTVALFAYAMFDPAGFAQRMVGLNAVPEPLWWLLGAIVAFYFGARETHYFRETRGNGARQAPASAAPAAPPAPVPPQGGARDNPALADWRRSTQAPQGN